MGMGLKLPGIFSLSAASLALLQSLQASATETPNQMLPESIMQPVGSNPIPDGMLLSPADQNEILRLYAGHRSHSSHSSHSSHASHSSHYSSSGYGGGTYTPPPRPVSPTYESAPAAPPVQYAYPPTKPRTNDPDVKRRVFEFRKSSAARGLDSYQYEVGKMYLDGDGVAQDRAAGRFYLEMAAQQGHAEAVRIVSTYKTNDALSKLESTNAVAPISTNTISGTNGPNSASVADQQWKKLFAKASEGSSDAQYELGMAYIAGEMVSKDLTKGKLLLEMAASQGKAEADGALRLLEVKH